MGSRNISFEPAASILGCAAFKVMKVSLCGPHSSETSALAPTTGDCVAPPLLASPFLARCWYFAHQVGLFGESVWHHPKEVTIVNTNTARMTTMLGRVPPPPQPLLSESAAAAG